MQNPGSGRESDPAWRSTKYVLTVVDSAMQSRLADAIGGIAQAIHLESVSAAITAGRNQPTRAVLLGANAIAREMAGELLRLTRTCPGAVLVAVLDGWDPEVPQRLLAFGGCGVRDAVDVTKREGLDRLRLLLTRPELDTGVRIANKLFPSIEQTTDGMQQFLSHLIRVAPSVSSSKALARGLGTGSSSMNSRFYRARLPSPKKYLAATRLLYAAAVLEDRRVSLADAAGRLNYSSPQSFMRHIREQFRVSATEFRSTYQFGGLADHYAYHMLVMHRSTLRWFEPLRGGGPGREA